MGMDQKGLSNLPKKIDKKTGKVLVEVSPAYFRPAEVEQLLGNPTKAKEKLGWEADTKAEKLCEIMVKADYEKAKQRGY